MPTTPFTLTLPRATDEYDAQVFQQLLDYIQALERAVYKKSQHVEIYSPSDSGGREVKLIIRSPDGTRWTIDVDNSGTLGTTDFGSTGL